MKLSLIRPVERIESAIAPPGKKPALFLIVRTLGMPDEIREIPMTTPVRPKRHYGRERR